MVAFDGSTARSHLKCALANEADWLDCFSLAEMDKGETVFGLTFGQSAQNVSIRRRLASVAGESLVRR
jgi:hypothetical protein